ncbi:hybrid sensor histidine kinase/response regulator [Polycyclovorans algicola]|uniref:hybrid sensor histidine kinase/response regulator n=1 Tax=Polycyclovorans algicola TaxID=616992 RepID=UPI0004A7790C|nr:PAS-domain containing protein [Polycyclovorans algicola]
MYDAPQTRAQRLALTLAVAAVIGLTAWLAGSQYGRYSLVANADQIREQLRLHDDTLQALIERYRVLPAVLALDPEVHAALADESTDAALTEQLNRKLSQINGAAATSTLTLLHRNGRAVAASNWASDDSNVGVDYRFRPYFQEALTEGSGSFYALGVTTSVPGYFLSQAVQDAEGRTLGVVVVKLVLESLQDLWRDLPDTVLVSDRYGVIFLSSVDAWRYRDLYPLDAETRERLAATRQYGDTAQTTMPLKDRDQPLPDARRVRLEGRDDMLWMSRPLPDQGWTLHVMRPLAPVQLNTLLVSAAVAGGLLLVTLLVLYLQQRRRMAVMRERGRIELESLVAQHAAEMRTAQDGLVQAARRADYGESPSLQHLPQGVCVIDAEQRLMAWNRRYVELFRFPQELIQVGRPIEDVLRFNASRGLLGAGPAEDTIARRLEHLRAGRPHMHEREGPDGTVIEIRGNPLPDGGFVTSYADITAYKQAARELRSLADTLERRIDERTRDLEVAKSDAERANRYKTRFVAAAVHDLLQPLNAARMFTSALRDRVQGETLRGLTDSVDGALAAQDEILDSLLDISRLESGALEVRRRTLALGPLLDSLAREIGVLAEAKGLRFRYHRTRAVVMSDEALLRRIVQNFLSNALRYTARGSLLLGVRQAGEQVRIEVWDTGPGIAESQQGMIFEEFRRLDSGGDLQARGAGLGLAIVDRIARLLGHRVGLRSWPGHGSVFSVTVARGDPAQVISAAAPTPAVSDSQLNGRHIWCVDDDLRVREGLAALLDTWGCRTTLLANAEQVLDAATPDAVPDLLLLDVRLGDDHGPDLVPQLLHRWGRPVPLILVTAERDEVLREQARAQGWGWLSKPVAPAALRALMTQRLLRSRDA